MVLKIESKSKSKAGKEKMSEAKLRNYFSVAQVNQQKQHLRFFLSFTLRSPSSEFWEKFTCNFTFSIQLQLVIAWSFEEKKKLFSFHQVSTNVAISSDHILFYLQSKVQVDISTQMTICSCEKYYWIRPITLSLCEGCFLTIELG